MVAIRPRSGDFVNVLTAPGQNITTAGTPLSVNGAGLLQIAGAADHVLGFSDEIINTTGGPATGTLVRVRVG